MTTIDTTGQAASTAPSGGTEPIDADPGGAATAGAGIRIVSRAEGRAVLEMTVTEEMLNGFHHVHGGYVFMLADSAFGMSCNGYGPRAVGAETSVTFMRPAELGMNLTAVGTRGTTFGRNVLATSVVIDEAGRHIAELHGRCVLVRENHFIQERSRGSEPAPGSPTTD